MYNSGNYFEVDGKSLGERNPKWLNDDYVKFIRFAQWRIERTGYGILGFHYQSWLPSAFPPKVIGNVV